MGVLEATFVAIVLVMMLSFLFVGWKSPEIVVFLALALVWNVGIVSTSDALSGFNNPGVLAVGSLFVVIKGVEKSRLADEAARHVFGLQTSYTTGLLRLMGLTFVLSAFLNNTPVVALLIPITRDWARTRGFSAAQLLMPLSFSCIFGGLLTIIGTSTNLVVQGLVMEASAGDSSISGLGFFEPGYIGLPLGLIGMAYLVVAAPRILPDKRDQPTPEHDGDGSSIDDFLTEVRIGSDSEFVGESLALILARLGLPVETLVKVRRERSGESSGERSRSPIVERSLRPSSEGTGDGANTDAMVGAEDCESFTPCLVYSLANVGTIAQRKRFGKHPSNSAKCESPRCTMKEPGYKAIKSGKDSSVSSPEPPRPHERWSIRAASADFEAMRHRSYASRRGQYVDLCPVSPSEIMEAHDSIFLRCSRSMMIEFQGSIINRGVRGLQVLDAKEPCVAERYRRFYEVVLSDASRCIGNVPSSDESNALATFYDCRVVAVRHASVSTDTQETASGSARASPTQRSSSQAECSPLATGLEAENTEDSNSPMRKGWYAQTQDCDGAKRADTKGEEVGVGEVTRQPLFPGDIALVLATEGFLERWKDAEDFDFVAAAGTVPEAVRRYDYLALVVFCGMLSWVLFSNVIMVRAAFAAGGALIVGGWVDPKKAIGYVDWALLLLVGSALGLSKAIANSGLAGYAGAAIRESGMSASVSLYVLYGFTMMCTELITNNAAAALAVPVALSIAQELEVSYKPFVITVMMAASSSFITPIGYQTNTMVWAPGGYKFSDFIRLGAPLSILNLVIGSSFMPLIFPF